MSKTMMAPADAETPKTDVCPTRTVEDWCAEKRTPDFAFAAAKVMNGWVAGQLLTEEQFDAGIRNQPISR